LAIVEQLNARIDSLVPQDSTLPANGDLALQCIGYELPAPDHQAKDVHHEPGELIYQLVGIELTRD
jgi:hypothetical protein